MATPIKNLFKLINPREIRMKKDNKINITKYCSEVRYAIHNNEKPTISCYIADKDILKQLFKSRKDEFIIDGDIVTIVSMIPLSINGKTAFDFLVEE